MTKFIKRTVAPKRTEKWYADHNPWRGGPFDMFTHNGNCTNFCYCEMSKILGRESKLPIFNAYCKSGKNWYDNCTKGYEKGQTPKIGAIIVYKHKGKASGHVALVVDIKSNGDLELQMSGWETFLWKTRIVKKSNNYCYSDYKLLGFIYCPIEFESNTTTYPGEFPVLPKRGYFKKGDKGTEVKKLQSFLNWALDINLSVDGILGNKTVSAVKKFQKLVGLKADGLFGKKSLEKAKTFEK